MKLTLSSDSQILRDLQEQYSKSRSKHRKLVRSIHAKESIARDMKLMKNPASTFAQIRASKRACAGKIHKLQVGPVSFFGDRVPDGFYASIQELKTRNKDVLYSQHFQSASFDYENILELSRESRDIRPISEIQSLELLKSMKPDVNDLYSITPSH